MRFKSSRFGQIEIRKEDVLTFPDGLLGFPDFKRYTLLDDKRHEPFMWMQSLDEADLAFVLINPVLIEPDYRVEASPEDVSNLEIRDPSRVQVLVIVSVPSDPMEMTANLKGPLIINPDSLKARQVVLMSDKYGTKHPIMKKTTAAE